MDCIYLDLRKAFDKVPHKQLSWKLETIGGLKGGLLRWMDDFLKNREMRTVIRLKKKICLEKCFLSGVPQGTVLAPVIFAVYVNDMTKRINSYNNLSADDAKECTKIKIVKHCNRTWTKYLSGPVHRKWNLIFFFNAVQWMKQDETRKNKTRKRKRPSKN